MPGATWPARSRKGMKYTVTRERLVVQRRRFILEGEFLCHSQIPFLVGGVDGTSLPQVVRGNPKPPRTRVRGAGWRSSVSHPLAIKATASISMRAPSRRPATWTAVDVGGFIWEDLATDLGEPGIRRKVCQVDL